MLGRWRGGRTVVLGVLIVGLLSLVGGAVILIQQGGEPVERTLFLGATLAPIPIAPLVDEDNGRVFILGSGVGAPGAVGVGILDGVNGRLVRIVPLPTVSLAPLALDRRHNRLIATGNAIAILDATSGNVLRVLAMETGPLAVDERTGHTFVAGPDSVSMLDASGNLSSAPPVPAQYPAAIAVDGQRDRVFVLNAGDGTVSTIDGRSGALIGTVATGLTPDVDARAMGRIAVDEQAGTVFAISSNTPLAAVLDAHSGRLMRTTKVGQGPGLLAIDEPHGRVVVANVLDNSVSLLDARNGALVRTVFGGLGPRGLAVDGRTGRAFVAAGDGMVRVLDTGNGVLIGAISAGATDAMDGLSQDIAVDERSGRVFVVSPRRNTVSVLDAGSGAVLRTVRVGTTPIGVAVDSARGRAYVVSQGSPQPAPDRWAWLPGWLRARLPFVSTPPSAPVNTGSVTVIDAAT